MVSKLTDQASIANQFIAELRSVDIQKDRMRFRRNLERIGEILAYEISKHLDFQELEVETPLGIAKTSIPSDQIVLATILRAGLPFHQGMLNYFDKAGNAFISAYRKHHKDGSFEIKMDYMSSPDIENRVLILCDPMLATGSSVDVTFKELFASGQPKQVFLATAIATTFGIDRIRRLYPEVHIFAGDIDDELTAKSYIVPGLGDAGDLSFGEKLQD